MHRLHASRRLASILGAALAASAVVVLSIPASQAASSCNFEFDTDPPETVITMFDNTSTIVRSGEDIVVDGVACATVTNAHKMVFYDNWGGSGQRGVISLKGGPFTPGLDTGPSPEVNFHYYSTIACDYLRIVGSGEREVIRWGSISGHPTANLNAEETEDIDADVTTSGVCVEPEVVAGGGDDVISAAGGLGTGNPSIIHVFFNGGPGNDKLTGGRNGDFLLGGAGADRIVGGDDDDRVLLGGDGRDVVVGGDGNDKLNGGAGYDVCKGGPGADRFVNCEKIVD